ncbi:hypothetical protein GQ42DRAFT_151961 [Ramicandelaber brevisporus]|nr:hypothetical protein GQ42DRAFT_151961 [Ramicandelaber brevisporus]
MLVNRTTALTSSLVLRTRAVPAIRSLQPQTRMMSLFPKKAGGDSTDDNVIYVGPLTRTVRNLRRISLTSSIASLTAAGPLVMMETGMPSSAKALIVGAAVGFSAISTGLIHLLFSPYLVRIVREPSAGDGQATGPLTADSVLRFDTTSIAGRDKSRLVRIGDLGPATRPMVTWNLVQTPSKIEEAKVADAFKGLKAAEAGVPFYFQDENTELTTDSQRLLELSGAAWWETDDVPQAGQNHAFKGDHEASNNAPTSQSQASTKA